jgi:hypothetical protein
MERSGDWFANLIWGKRGISASRKFFCSYAVAHFLPSPLRSAFDHPYPCPTFPKTRRLWIFNKWACEVLANFNMKGLTSLVLIAASQNGSHTVRNKRANILMVERVCILSWASVAHTLRVLLVIYIVGPQMESRLCSPPWSSYLESAHNWPLYSDIYSSYLSQVDWPQITPLTDSIFSYKLCKNSIALKT